MKSYFLILFAVTTMMLAVACGSQQVSNNGNANANSGVNRNNVNLPEGFSVEPITPGPGETPGIPANNTTRTVPSNVSPAEGIPSADDLKKPLKPGATPTPGIPSPDELKRMKNAANTNVKP